MRGQFTTSKWTSRFLLIVCVFYVLAASAPAVVPEDSNPPDSAIAPVANTGSYEELFDAAEDSRNQTPTFTKIPSKDETARQIDIHRIRPFTLAHRVEGTLRVVGLEEQTNVILDTLCLLAYAYLLRLTSKSYLYTMEILQILAFICFPALPIVQCLNNTFRLVARSLYDGSLGLRHSLAHIVGQYTTPSRASQPLSILEKADDHSIPVLNAPVFRQRLTHLLPHELDFSHGPALSLFRRISGIILVLLTMMASVTTLHMHFDHPVRSDWDSIGIAADQRHGWLASSATLSACLSLIALFINSEWTIKPEFARPEFAVGVLEESEIFTEMATAALLQDLFGGLSGADSFSGFLAEVTISRWGLLVLLMLILVFNKRLAGVARSVLGSHIPRRGSSGVALSKPAISILALAICLVVGGYHLVGQAMTMWMRPAHKSASVGSGLSEGLVSVG